MADPNPPVVCSNGLQVDAQQKYAEEWAVLDNTGTWHQAKHTNGDYARELALEKAAKADLASEGVNYKVVIQEVKPNSLNSWNGLEPTYEGGYETYKIVEIGDLGESSGGVDGYGAGIRKNLSTGKWEFRTSGNGPWHESTISAALAEAIYLELTGG